MSIDEQPMNVYWSGQKSPTSNKYKIDYKGTVATASALPATGNKKGDTYNISEDGSDYIWTGTEWNKFGTNVYIGATDSANGIQGLVPAPEIGDQGKVLKGDGTWDDVGNAATASQLQTARTIAISGAATGSASFDGSADADIEVVRRSCVNKNMSSSPTTAPWYKAASVSSTSTGNTSITFITENIYSGEAISLGHVDARFNSGEILSQSNIKFSWFIGQGSAIKVIVPDGDIRNTVEIWIKIATQYGAYRLTVLGEGTDGTSSNRWTLYSATTAGQEASVPAGWDIAPVLYTPVDLSHNQTVDGKKTFTSPLILDAASSSWAMQASDKTHYLMLVGGNSNNGQVGAQGILYGCDHSTSPGNFKLHAGKSGSTKDFIGMPDGTLTWDGQAIQTTSDERLKTALSSVPDAVLDAWGDVQWGKFQYLDAVEAKGENARLHLGLVAQRVKAVFEARNMDACAYGILCHEVRPEVNEPHTVVDIEAYTDEQGMEHPAVTHVEMRHEDAVDLWMVRYAEAQAMEAAYQRRRAERAEARIKALEDRLEVLEAKLA